MRIAPDQELPVAVQPCPLCGAVAFETLVRQDRHLLGLRTVGCTGCGLLQTNPRPDAAGLDSFYTHHYRRLYQGVDDPDAAYVSAYRKDERLRYTAAHLLQVLRLGPQSHLLDYGCGEGSLFVALRQAGFEGRLSGVEPNARFAAFAAQQGRASVTAGLPEVHDLDAVVLNHVLEHLADPVGLLGALRQRMKPQGLLYIDVPDAERYARVGDLHLAHILHFTARTLPTVVAAAGFEPLHCQPHDPPHHPLSLRLAARPVAQPAVRTPAASSAAVAAEQAAWQHLRRINRTRWRWTLSQHLGRIGPVRAAHAAWQRWRDGAPSAQGLPPRRP
jgi:2-polyprenyl-3-methyl-5-hydroxy-6-metoxy-1,4-benzoquinol methylase